MQQHPANIECKFQSIGGARRQRVDNIYAY
jgi:hypothetical protein